MQVGVGRRSRMAQVPLALVIGDIVILSVGIGIVS